MTVNKVFTDLRFALRRLLIFYTNWRKWPVKTKTVKDMIIANTALTNVINQYRTIMNSLGINEIRILALKMMRRIYITYDAEHNVLDRGIFVSGNDCGKIPISKRMQKM